MESNAGVSPSRQEKGPVAADSIKPNKMEERKKRKSKAHEDTAETTPVPVSSSVESLTREVRELREEVRALKKLRVESPSAASVAPGRQYMNSDLVQPSLVRMGLSLDVLKAMVLDLKEGVVGTTDSITRMAARLNSLCFAVDAALDRLENRDEVA